MTPKKNVGKCFDYANRKGAYRMVFVAPDEVDRGMVRVKGLYEKVCILGLKPVFHITLRCFPGVCMPKVCTHEKVGLRRCHVLSHAAPQRLQECAVHYALRMP
jgi:hypothetical protein